MSSSFTHSSGIDKRRSVTGKPFHHSVLGKTPQGEYYAMDVDEDGNPVYPPRRDLNAELRNVLTGSRSHVTVVE